MKKPTRSKSANSARGMKLRKLAVCLCVSWSVSSFVGGLATAAEPKPSTPKETARPKPVAATLPAGVRAVRNVEFARHGEHSLKLDLYLPTAAQAKPLPLVVWVHGGGWSGGSKDRCPAVYLATDGFIVASISYRLTGVAQWPAQIDDCRAAIRWLREHAEEYGIDAANVGVWGGSAGGHLVALLGTLDERGDGNLTSTKIQAVCDWYGPTDLLTMPPNVLSAGKTEADLAKSNGAKLLGGAVRDRPELAKQASALYQVSAGDAPFLIMHGDQDPGVPVDQSRRLHEALQSAGVPSTLEIIVGAGHGGPGFQTDAVKQTVREFFERTLKVR